MYDDEALFKGLVEFNCADAATVDCCKWISDFLFALFTFNELL